MDCNILEAGCQYISDLYFETVWTGPGLRRTIPHRSAAGSIQGGRYGKARIGMYTAGRAQVRGGEDGEGSLPGRTRESGSLRGRGAAASPAFRPREDGAGALRAEKCPAAGKPAAGLSQRLWI